PSLPTGAAWMWAPELDVLHQVSFPANATYDSGKPLAAGRKGPEPGPLDLAAVRGRLELVAKEAVENDPRRLKARIAVLEEALATNERAKSSAVSQTEIAAAEQRGHKRGYSDGIRHFVATLADWLPSTRARLAE